MKNAGQLSERLGEKLASRKKEILEMEKIERENLLESLKSEYQAALSTITADIQGQAQQLSLSLSESLKESENNAKSLKKALKREWIKPAIMSLSICLSIFFSTWGVMQLLSNTIETQIMEIQKNMKTLETLKSKGGAIHLDFCGESRKLCIQIDLEAQEFQNGYRILK